MKKEVKIDMNIFTEIANITTGKELDAVIDAINAQSKIIRSIEAAKKKAVLSVGDKVTINGKRTKGNVGNIGVISRMKVKRAIVRCKNDQGETVLWDCPFSILEAV